MKIIENIKNNKVEPFPLDKKNVEESWIDLKIKEGLISAADAYEQKLNSDPNLDSIKAPVDLFSRIVRELKEKNLWKEEQWSKEDIDALAIGKIVKENGVDGNAVLKTSDLI